ncbi:protein of unknown function [Taphrina deformans PYCC 5710]|uniref:Cytochrome P450 n=1 Tax=Taphrina deformans (strain PYCC 5710 / ATCC 11124 / CBS 356.35 / IMI 108563 / JCM 9778 / NBRC 8474) TaxID=1097556 RepID=R4XED0_TAPDE|nr:protein of unknown function [Taphrina deformans PYCC 5710]|eukprot:CCG84027.1 protein of unknown function [Taphrina deformans PYCC 5710]
MIADQLEAQTVLWICIVLVVAHAVTRSLYRSFVLKNVPGPWYTLVSDWSLVWQEYRHNRTRWIHGLHAEYGPIVRLSNSEVHYNSTEAVKKIYGVRGPAVKESYYAEFAKDGHENMFSTIDEASHGHRKRGVANHYARSSLLTEASLSMLREKVAQCCSLLYDPDGVQLYTALSYFTFDVISSVVYGRQSCAQTLVQNGLNRLRLASDGSTLCRMRRFFRKSGHYTIAALTHLLYAIRQMTPITRVSASPGADGLDGYIFETCGKITSTPEEGLAKESASLAEKLLYRGCTNAYMLSETRDHVIAGSDTTTTVLTYLFYTLATRPDVYSKLRLELARVGRDENGRLVVTEIEACTYLDAVITEALRLFAAIPMSLPRVLSAPLDLHGTRVPQGTRVGVQCYSMHREPSTFPEPEAYKPERWENATKSMSDHMWAFSSGSRSCVGKALAMLEMKLLAAEVVSRFSISLVGEICPDAMMMAEDTTAFAMAPRDRSVKLRFKHRPNDEV